MVGFFGGLKPQRLTYLIEKCIQFYLVTLEFCRISGSFHLICFQNHPKSGYHPFGQERDLKNAKLTPGEQGASEWMQLDGKKKNTLSCHIMKPLKSLSMTTIGSMVGPCGHRIHEERKTSQVLYLIEFKVFKQLLNLKKVKIEANFRLS